MKALKSRAAVIAGALVASTAMLVPLAAPAGAATLVDGCSFTTNPASGGSQSALRVACNFPTASKVPAKNVISDFSNAQWHNGAARAINGIGFEGAYGSSVIVSPNAHFTSADTNRQIAGTIGGSAIGAYTNIKIVVDASTVVLNLPASSTGLAGKTSSDLVSVDAKLENSSIRAGIAAVTTASSSASVTGVTITKPASGNATSTKTGTAWNAGDIGKQVVSIKLTGGAGFITAVSSGVATLSTTATATASSQTITLNTLGQVISPTIGFSASDVGRSIAGTPLSSTAKIVSTGTVPSGQLAGHTYAVVSGTTVASQADLTSNPAYPNQVTIGADEVVSTTRILNDFTYDLANQRIVASAGFFRGSDIGLPISGCGVASYANGATLDDQGQNYIDAVALDGSWVHTKGGVYGNSVAVVNGATCAQAFGSYGINLTIGLPSVTSAANGDVMSTIASTLNLSPALVPGSDSCASNTYEGTTIQGQWYNPGSIGASSAFSGNANAAGSQSASVVFSPSFSITPIKATNGSIGAIKYPTAVVSFWAFVSQRTASETVGDKSFAAGTAKISLPWVPTLLALCDGTGISSEYTFQGTSIATQSVATGTGRPSTALRGLKSGPLAGDVAYQPTTVADVSSVWTGAGKFSATGALGQGVVAKLVLQP